MRIRQLRKVTAFFVFLTLTKVGRPSLTSALSSFSQVNNLLIATWQLLLQCPDHTRSVVNVFSDTNFYWIAVNLSGVTGVPITGHEHSRF